jgi:DNA polymerase-3 subunit delta
MRAFAQADRFLTEVQSRKLRPAYVFVGDETFFRKRCREAILEHLVPSELRDFSLFDFDLSETDLAEVLDRARTPSLMAPFQVFFVKGVKTMFGRGSNEDKLTAIEQYCKDPNPDAVIIFVADHISIPADVRKMDMQDKERYERIREAMGPYCGIVELSRVEEGEAVRWLNDYCATCDVKIEADAARELVDALGGDMMMVSNELEKLILYVGEKKRVTLGDVETMVLAAKQRSLYELTDAISSKDRVKALKCWMRF